MPYHGSSWSNARLAFQMAGSWKSLPTKLTFWAPEKPGPDGTVWFGPSGLNGTSGSNSSKLYEV